MLYVIILPSPTNVNLHIYSRMVEKQWDIHLLLYLSPFTKDIRGEEYYNMSIDDIEGITITINTFITFTFTRTWMPIIQELIINICICYSFQSISWVRLWKRKWSATFVGISSFPKSPMNTANIITIIHCVSLRKYHIIHELYVTSLRSHMDQNMNPCIPWYHNDLHERLLMILWNNHSCLNVYSGYLTNYTKSGSTSD